MIAISSLRVGVLYHQDLVIAAVVACCLLGCESSAPPPQPLAPPPQAPQPLAATAPTAPKPPKKVVEGVIVANGGMFIADNGQTGTTGRGTIEYPPQSRFPLEFDPLTGVFAVYERDRQMGLRLGGQDIYTGDVVDGEPHGSGEMEGFQNRYTGAWDRGKYHGEGTFSQERTGYEYTGGWKQGKRHGRATLRFLWDVYLDKTNNLAVATDPKVDSFSHEYLKVECTGRFVDDLMHGRSKCTVASLPAQKLRFHKGRPKGRMKVGDNLWLKLD